MNRKMIWTLALSLLAGALAGCAEQPAPEESGEAPMDDFDTGPGTGQDVGAENGAGDTQPVGGDAATDGALDTDPGAGEDLGAESGTGDDATMDNATGDATGANTTADANTTMDANATAGGDMATGGGMATEGDSTAAEGAAQDDATTVA